MKRGIVAALLVAIAMDASVAIGQTAAEPKTVDRLGVNYVVPDSAAFAILDLTPESVVRPKSPRELATSLLSGVDREGNFQTGIALDVNPYLLLEGPELTLADYRRNPDGFNLDRLLSRTQLSLATTKGASSDDESVRIALGGLVVPFDDGDPRMDSTLGGCIGDAQRKARDSMTVEMDAAVADIHEAILSTTDPAKQAWVERLMIDENTGLLNQPDPLRAWETVGEYDKTRLRKEFPAIVRSMDDFLGARSAAQTALDVAVEVCRKEARKRNENASAWAISGAPRWESTSGSIDDVRFRGGGVWTSFALGRRTSGKEEDEASGLEWLVDASQIIATVRYRSDTPVPDPDDDGQFIDQDDILVGARWRVGVERIRFSLEGAYLHEERDGMPDQDIGRFSVGAEIKIAENWWLQVSGGGESGSSDDNGNQGFVLSSIKFALPSEPSIPLTVPPGS